MPNRTTRIYVFFALVFFWGSISAQEIKVSYVFYPHKKPLDLKKNFIQQIFKDSISFIDYLKNQQQILFEKAYLSTSVDSIVGQNQSLIAYVYIGAKVSELLIRFDPKYEDLLSKVNSKYLLKGDLKAMYLESENKKIIDYLDENAYPFAQVKIDSISFENNRILGFLNIDRGTRVKYGKVDVEGSFRISKSFLQGYTGIKTGATYDFKKLQKVKKVVNDLTFAKQDQDISLKIDSDFVDVTLPIDKMTGNRFDGILGILPNDKTTGKTVLTGELNVALQNILRSGETFNFEWKKLESSSQNLDVNFEIPYIFNTKFGISSDLSLLKQDSTFLNANLALAALYFLEANNHLGLRYINKSSSTLLEETLINSNYKDFKIHSYGLTFKYSSLDYNFNPRRGLDFEMEAYLGRKTSYLETKEVSTQSELRSKIKWYLPLLKKSTILLSFQAANLNAPQLYTNELYRIGGLSSIRGFMESSIYASSYSIASLEYRFVFERNSALFTFVDLAWIEKRQDIYYYDYPIGLGLGLFFKTRAGIFTISYAMGQQKNEQMAIKNAKIHFGFINKF